MAYVLHPERFVKRPPSPPELPATAWINPPKEKSAPQNAPGSLLLTEDNPTVYPLSNGFEACYCGSFKKGCTVNGQGHCLRIIDRFRSGLDIKSEVREPELYANVEWYIPTALIIFIGKAYFDSFLKEMGKEHYHLFKKGISSLWKYFFGPNRIIKFNLIASKGKVSAVPQYSIALSLMTDLPDNYRIKYLFKDNLSEADFEKNINHFFDFLDDLSSGCLNPEIKKTTPKCNKCPPHTVAYI
jgi:hypothetical protein